MSRMLFLFFFFFQAEDGIRDLVRSRGLGDVYKRQVQGTLPYEILLNGSSWGLALDHAFQVTGLGAGAYTIQILSLIHI